MPTLGTAYLSSILGAAEAPCVSIYLPTSRAYPDSQQNPIRLRNLVRTAVDGLGKSRNGNDPRGIVEKLRALADDELFWTHTLDGTVILASPERFDVFTLPRAMPERAEVGSTFHVKPLIRHVQSADQFHVLAVSRERVALFAGTRYDLAPLAVPGIPLTVTEALGEELTERRQGLHTAGPAPGPRGGNKGGPGTVITHGQGARKEEILTDMHRFYRVVDRKVTDLVSEPAKVPLVLAGLPDNLAEFRAVAQNPHLIEGAVTENPFGLEVKALQGRVWAAVEPYYRARLARIREDYGTAAARQQATGELSDATRAAAHGRVGTLLIDADKTRPGALDFATGEPRPAGQGDASAGDMLDDLAELVLRNGGTVTVVPAAEMPTDTGLAAIYRY